MKGSAAKTQVGLPDRTRFRLQGRSVLLDTRVHAVRGDLADIALAGTFFSAHYARAVPMTCVAPGTALNAGSAVTTEAVSQLLRGETFHALDVTINWAWGFCEHDGYVGYIRRDALDVREALTHRIVALRAPIFADADIKSPVRAYWPAGAQFGATEEGDFLGCAEGFVHRRHAQAVGHVESDWVAVASRYLGAPYVWGGRGHGGVDCSGLVQIALGRCGLSVPRDTDLQRESVGSPIAEDSVLRRGDFIFFPGHVGIMTDESHILHANAHWMATVIEPLSDVIDRLKDSHDRPILTRRRIG